jgi:hypothetical protein
MREETDMQAVAPWYRQAWPWLVMAPPLAAVVGGIALLWVAIATSDGLVTPEYESRRAALQRALTPEEAANCAAKDRACLNAPVQEAR